MVRVLETFLIFALLFNVYLITTIGLNVFNTMLLTKLGDDADTNEVIDNIIASFQKIDALLIFFLIGLGILNFLTGWFLDESPIFFFFELLFFVISFVISAVLQNFYMEFTTNSTWLGGYLSTQPYAVAIFNNMTIIYLGLGSLYLVGRYAKSRFTV